MGGLYIYLPREITEEPAASRKTSGKDFMAPNFNLPVSPRCHQSSATASDDQVGPCGALRERQQQAICAVQAHPMSKR